MPIYQFSSPSSVCVKSLSSSTAGRSFEFFSVNCQRVSYIHTYRYYATTVQQLPRIILYFLRPRQRTFGVNKLPAAAFQFVQLSREGLITAGSLVIRIYIHLYTHYTILYIYMYTYVYYIRAVRAVVICQT